MNRCITWAVKLNSYKWKRLGKRERMVGCCESIAEDGGGGKWVDKYCETSSDRETETA